MPRLVCLSMLFCMSWPPFAFALVDETPPTPPVEVLRADFGLFNASPSGGWILTRTSIIPLKKGQHYGWSILLKTNKPVVKWREEFTLPSPPVSWVSDGLTDPSQTISPDHMTSILEVDAIPVNGVIRNVWEVTAGDPKGHYRIRVTIEGDNQQVFEFDVR
ncbi:MAG: hypothetical protein WBX11_10410 [Thiobacillaceae bacterium]